MPVGRVLAAAEGVGTGSVEACDLVSARVEADVAAAVAALAALLKG